MKCFLGVKTVLVISVSNKYYSAANSKLLSMSSFFKASLYIKLRKVRMVWAEISSMFKIPSNSSRDSLVDTIVSNTSLRALKMNLDKGILHYHKQFWYHFCLGYFSINWFNVGLVFNGLVSDGCISTDKNTVDFLVSIWMLKMWMEWLIT